MTIVKRGKKFVLKSKRTGRTLGKHGTKKEAKAQDAAINISKARKAGHRIPKKSNK